MSPLKTESFLQLLAEVKETQNTGRIQWAIAGFKDGGDHLERT